MTTSKYVPLALAAALAISASGAALANGRGDEKQEANALQSAKVSLSQAIATAEQQTGGKAFDAGVDVKNGAARIAVETNGPKGVQTVIVDAQSGIIVGTHAGGEQD